MPYKTTIFICVKGKLLAKQNDNFYPHYSDTKLFISIYANVEHFYR